MTKAGEKSAKPGKSPVSKKEKLGDKPKPAKSPASKKEQSEDTPKAVDWEVEDFAKDEAYFHNVIGLPNVGKVPKDITAQDVPLEKLDHHFGVKAKNDKNGYKKEGVKGIPAEDIQKLVIALDGIDKFQLFSLEVARGLYYERILKRAVNWAACGVDKHRGQLAWRLRRNAPVQADSPPWKRVEHKYSTPAGLELTVAEEEQEHYPPIKSTDKSETPGGGKKARKARKAGDVAPAEGSLENESEPLGDSSAGKARNPRRAIDVAVADAKSGKEGECPNEGRTATNVASEMEKEGECPNEGRTATNVASEMEEGECPNEGRTATNVALEMETDQGSLVGSTPLLPCDPIHEPAEQGCLGASTSRPMLVSDAGQTPPDQEQPTPAASSSLISLGQEVPDVDKTCKSTSAEILNPDCQFLDNEACSFPDNAGFEDVQTLETIATVAVPKVTSVDGQVDASIPMQKCDNELSPVSYPDSCLQLVEGILQEVSSELDRALLDTSLLAARMKGNKQLLLGADEETRQFMDTMAACREEMSQLRKDLEGKVLEIHTCQTNMLLCDEDDRENEIRDQQFLALCAEATAVNDAIALARSQYDAAKDGVRSLFPNMNEADEAGFEMQDQMDKLKLIKANRAKTQTALSAEFSRLEQVLGKGSVHVRPVSMISPLQSEERVFPITECPVCSLGFYCNNWVPTPCGHCYHPSCLFSLLQIDDNRAPKCEACSEVFHPHWLQCWGLPQANHPEVTKLVDEWGLEEQAKSFRLTVTNLYSKNAAGIDTRRKTQAARHKKATKLYSQEIIKKSTEYHETIGRAELVKYKVMLAESKKDHKVGRSEAVGCKDEIVKSGTETADNSPCITAETGDDLQKLKLWPVNLAIVKKEKGAPELVTVSKEKRKGSGEIAKEGEDGATTGEGKVSGDTRQKETVNMGTTAKKHKGSGETANESNDGGTTGEGNVSGETRKEETRGNVNKGTTAKKRKGSGEIGKDGNDVGTTVQSPSKSRLRRGTLPQTTQVVPPSTMTRRSHQPKK